MSRSVRLCATDDDAYRGIVYAVRMKKGKVIISRCTCNGGATGVVVLDQLDVITASGWEETCRYLTEMRIFFIKLREPAKPLCKRHTIH